MQVWHDDLAQQKARLRLVETEKQILLQDITHLKVDEKRAALKKLNEDLIKAQKTIKVQSDQISGGKKHSNLMGRPNALVSLVVYTSRYIASHLQHITLLVISSLTINLPQPQRYRANEVINKKELGQGQEHSKLGQCHPTSSIICVRGRKNVYIRRTSLKNRQSLPFQPLLRSTYCIDQVIPDALHQERSSHGRIPLSLIVQEG